MQSTIFLENLEVQTIIGICEWELDKPQPLYFDIAMEVNSDRVSQSDAIEDALDYAAVAIQVEQYVQSSHVKLLEPLLSGLAKRLFLEFEMIDAMTLTVRKPRAIENASCAGVSWHCTRAEAANQ